jgi:hypothetical protein
VSRKLPLLPALREALARPSWCLSLAKSCSIGLRSGEYLGRKSSLAPVWRMARRIALALCAEIIHDHQIALEQAGREHLSDIGEKALAVDRTIEQPGRLDPVAARRGQEGQRVPMSERQVLAPRRPATQRRHIGFGPCLIDKDQPRRIDSRPELQPLRAPSGRLRSRATSVFFVCQRLGVDQLPDRAIVDLEAAFTKLDHPAPQGEVPLAAPRQ